MAPEFSRPSRTEPANGPVLEPIPPEPRDDRSGKSGKSGRSGKRDRHDKHDRDRFQVDSRVTHRLFGVGIILDSRPYKDIFRLTVDFDERDEPLDIRSDQVRTLDVPRPPAPDVEEEGAISESRPTLFTPVSDDGPMEELEKLEKVKDGLTDEKHERHVTRSP